MMRNIPNRYTCPLENHGMGTHDASLVAGKPPFRAESDMGLVWSYLPRKANGKSL